MKTIEGLRGTHPLQETFVTEGGAQCGICTPGMILAAAALPANATLDEIRVGLAGNLCRCTGYEGIYRAIRKAPKRKEEGRRMKEDSNEDRCAPPSLPSGSSSPAPSRKRSACSATKARSCPSPAARTFT